MFIINLQVQVLHPSQRGRERAEDDHGEPEGVRDVQWRHGVQGDRPGAVRTAAVPQRLHAPLRPLLPSHRTLQRQRGAPQAGFPHRLQAACQAG